MFRNAVKAERWLRKIPAALPDHHRWGRDRFRNSKPSPSLESRAINCHREAPPVLASRENRLLRSDHLVQTQRVGLQNSLINLLPSTSFGVSSSDRRGTVVDFVAVRSSRFNTVLQLAENQRLKTNGLQGGVQIEHLVPNQVTRSRSNPVE